MRPLGANRVPGKEKKNDAGGEGVAAERRLMEWKESAETKCKKKVKEGKEKMREGSTLFAGSFSSHFPLVEGESRRSGLAAWFLCSWSLLIEAVKPQPSTAAPSIFTLCRIEIKQMTP